MTLYETILEIHETNASQSTDDLTTCSSHAQRVSTCTASPPHRVQVLRGLQIHLGMKRTVTHKNRETNKGRTCDRLHGLGRHLGGIMTAGVIDLVARNPEGISSSCIVEDVVVILGCREDFKLQSKVDCLRHHQIVLSSNRRSSKA